MVYIIEVDSFKYYACSICGLIYESEETASKCEEFCKNNPGKCNIEIAKESIGYIEQAEGGSFTLKFKVLSRGEKIRPVYKICKHRFNIYTAC